MISGVHAIVFSEAPDQMRAFFRDTLGLEHVDAGGGWLVFALPPAELAVHPGEASRHELYLMCDDLELTVAELVDKGVRPVGPVREQVWGRVTTLALPDGSEIGLYQPTHPRPGAPTP